MSCVCMLPDICWHSFMRTHTLTRAHIILGRYQMTFGIRVLVDLGLDPNKGVSLSSIIRTIPGVEVLGFSYALVNLYCPTVKDSRRDVLLLISRFRLVLVYQLSHSFSRHDVPVSVVVT